MSERCEKRSRKEDISGQKEERKGPKKTELNIALFFLVLNIAFPGGLRRSTNSITLFNSLTLCSRLARNSRTDIFFKV